MTEIYKKDIAWMYNEHKRNGVWIDPDVNTEERFLEVVANKIIDLGINDTQARQEAYQLLFS